MVNFHTFLGLDASNLTLKSAIPRRHWHNELVLAFHFVRLLAGTKTCESPLMSSQFDKSVICRTDNSDPTAGRQHRPLALAE